MHLLRPGEEDRGQHRFANAAPNLYVHWTRTDEAELDRESKAYVTNLEAEKVDRS
jgi:hypothetical protein